MPDKDYRYSGELAEIAEYAEVFPADTDLRAIGQWCKPSDRLLSLGLFAPDAPVLTPGDLPPVVGQLLTRLQQDIPVLRHAALVDPTWGYVAAWHGAAATVFLPPPTAPLTRQVQALLHEAGHAVCGHQDMGDLDIDTHVQHERAAWEKALELAHQYRVGRYLWRPTVKYYITNLETRLRRLLWAVGKIAGTDRAFPAQDLLRRWMREDGYSLDTGDAFLDRLEQYPEYYALRDRGPVFARSRPRRTSLRVPRFRLDPDYQEGALIAGVLRQVVEGTFPKVALPCVAHNEPGWVGSAYLLDGQDLPGGGYAELIGLVHREALAQAKPYAVDWMWFSATRKVDNQPCVYFVEVVAHETALGPAFIFVPGPDPKNIGQQALLSYITSLGSHNSFFRRQLQFSSWEECRAFARRLQQRPWDDEAVTLEIPTDEHQTP